MTYKYHLFKLHICFLLIMIVISFCGCSSFSDYTAAPKKSAVEINTENTEESSVNSGYASSDPEYSDSVLSAPVLSDMSAVFTEASAADTSAAIDTAAADTPSLLDFLQIAIQPACQTMYIWGGGWNEDDTGAGIEAVTLGLSPRWAEFTAAQDASYNYKKTRYQIHDGLDCSGFVGWAVYNVLENENQQEGYVTKSTHMAQHFAERGLGQYLPASDVTNWQPGDICSMKGHVWISLGMCSDNSVLLLHASPPGVIFSGTLLPDGSVSEAVKLAEQITQTYHPDWYEKFPACSRSHNYLTKSSVMRWNADILNDPEGISNMSAEEIVNLLFSE